MIGKVSTCRMKYEAATLILCTICDYITLFLVMIPPQALEKSRASGLKNQKEYFFRLRLNSGKQW